MSDKVIIADVHSNLTALEKVLERIRDPDETDLYCLGDVVGYGPEPNACVELLRSRDAHILAGNHDAAACGRLSAEYFNHFARRAVEWTAEQLNDDNRQYLSERPDQIEDAPFDFYHGSPLEPLTEYITGTHQAERAVQEARQPMVGVGHTHQPALFRGNQGRLRAVSTQGNQRVSEISTDEQLVFNPGSVGQPRDGDPRASFVVVEEPSPGTINLLWKRVEYDIATVQEKIRKAGLPEKLATRLPRGH
jgi:diadenosine tetraphosphatase ApaH/serine/threonine PP2A family protein phosphatase